MDQVARRVERQRWIEGDVDGIRGRGRQNRVAVRRRIDDALGADIAAGPGLFSNTKGWPSRSASRSQTGRASRPVAPPAANGSTQVTGRLG
jgi:hypothetical protein